MNDDRKIFKSVDTEASFNGLGIGAKNSLAARNACCNYIPGEQN